MILDTVIEVNGVPTEVSVQFARARWDHPAMQLELIINKIVTASGREVVFESLPTNTRIQLIDQCETRLCTS